jgi:hypothetical protein
VIDRTQKQIRRGTGLPRFNVGDKVTRAKHPFKGRFRETKKPIVGVVHSVVIKLNASNHKEYYYQIKWAKSDSLSLNSQRRLELAP